jgi:hypothetical protein
VLSGITLAMAMKVYYPPLLRALCNPYPVFSRRRRAVLRPGGNHRGFGERRLPAVDVAPARPDSDCQRQETLNSGRERIDSLRQNLTGIE